jgi:predicted anti-sigma-YlaC factor YlaD
MSRVTLDCQAVQVQLDAWLTAELDSDSADAVQRHLACCPQCREFLADLQLMRDTVLEAENSAPLTNDTHIKAAIRRIAGQQRAAYEAGLPRVRVRRWAQRLLWIAYALFGLVLHLVLQAPLALRLFTVGVALNLVGLALVPWVIKNQGSWSQA